MTEAAFHVHHAGDTAIVFEFGDIIAPHLNAMVLEFSDTIEALRIPGVVEAVPTFRSLLVEYDPEIISAESLIATLSEFPKQAIAAPRARRSWVLPICYDEKFAPDLGEVCKGLDLSPRVVTELHSSCAYEVFMLGFLPGQPYLGEVDPALRLSRRSSPRSRIDAGAVGIAGSMTSIFPTPSPSGWNIIGRTPVPLWNFRTQSSPLLQPGDCVRFMPISQTDFASISAQVETGEFALHPVEERDPCHH